MGDSGKLLDMMNGMQTSLRQILQRQQRMEAKQNSMLDELGTLKMASSKQDQGNRAINRSIQLQIPTHQNHSTDVEGAAPAQYVSSKPQRWSEVPHTAPHKSRSRDSARVLRAQMLGGKRSSGGEGRSSREGGLNGARSNDNDLLTEEMYDSLKDLCDTIVSVTPSGQSGKNSDWGVLGSVEGNSIPNGASHRSPDHLLSAKSIATVDLLSRQGLAENGFRPLSVPSDRSRRGSPLSHQRESYKLATQVNKSQRFEHLQPPTHAAPSPQLAQ